MAAAGASTCRCSRRWGSGWAYGPFPTGDGKTVMLGLQNEREWVLFCDKVLQQPALAKDERFTGNAKRVASRDALRGRIVETFATPAGPVPTLLPPGSWDDGDPRLDAVPTLGQHTDAILAELGLDAAAIAALRADQAI
jgi:itaconate CoA-transferase